MSTAPTLLSKSLAFEQLVVQWNEADATLWCHMNPHPRPCFNPGLLSELRTLKTTFERYGITKERMLGRPHFIVFASSVPDVFNLGGDLVLFKQLIQMQDRQRLEQYATACIDASFKVSSGYDLPVTTISLVQGTALGGGMEGALAANVVVAERGVQMGLPEVMFNLFPGMGAFSFLSRRLGAHEAERVILSGKTWKAEELHELGLIDILAEPGHGEIAVRDFVASRQRRSPNATIAMQQVRKAVNPVSYQELEDIAMIWVDAALRLNERDLKIMERLARSQDRLKTPPSMAKAV
jgi:DSF synthase